MGKCNQKGLAMKMAFKNEMKAKRKKMKNVLQARRAKLVVKNLPFKTNEKKLKSYFEQYGEVENVNILKKSDGKMVGCAFVQFKLVQNAAKAKHHLNGQIFLSDRVIEVDFAKPKDKYKKEKKKHVAEITPEKEKDNLILSCSEIEDDKNIEAEIKTEKHTNMEDVDCDSIKQNESNTSSDYEMDNEIIDTLNKKNDVSKKPHYISNDISEGKTVFIKNVPFSATSDDLKECMSQYGPIIYALICMDHLTEHSKGTAFVKFRNKEDAEICLQAGTELILQGNVLDCHPALHKNVLVQKEKEKKIKEKDTRNLYLVKEGVILAGTKAAEGVSASDMAKRLQLEQYKTQMLRNLNMYISKTRLIIHNLPPTWNDSQLRTLFKKCSDSDAVIQEARIMRDMRNVDSQGIGKSKEYGFVTFTKHEDALKALRHLNNNPITFSINKRPIVAFSIENRRILKAKEKRLQKSKMRNPNCKEYNPQLDKKGDGNNINKQKLEQADTINIFTGVTATPGVRKMRSKFNIKMQAKLHHQYLKKEKKERKNTKRIRERKPDFRKEPKLKINKKEQQDDFSILVNKYKQHLKSTSVETSKWYE